MSAYNEKETEKMIQLYTNDPSLKTVDRLAVKFNKTRKSVIAKLSKEGVYLSSGYKDKRGRPPVTKLEMVKQIEDILECQLPGLDKAPKETIRTLTTTLEELDSILRATIEEARVLVELKELNLEMKKAKLAKTKVDDDTFMDIGFV